MSKADIEAVKLAAKAGGLHLYHVTPEGALSLDSGHWWKPRHDLGDAMRLAVSLGMTVSSDLALGRSVAEVKAPGGAGVIRMERTHAHHGAESATCHAIVDAAAELARRHAAAAAAHGAPKKITTSM